MGPRGGSETPPRPSRPGRARLGLTFLLGPESASGPPTASEQILAKKLYVGNLTYSITDSDLQELFSAYGGVLSAQVIIDRDTNRSKGFGFVEMETDEAAQDAIAALNGHNYDGRNLTVNEAKPREPRTGGGGGYGGGRGGYGGGGGGGYGGGGGGRRY